MKMTKVLVKIALFLFGVAVAFFFLYANAKTQSVVMQAMGIICVIGGAILLVHHIFDRNTEGVSFLLGVFAIFGGSLCFLFDGIFTVLLGLGV